jgi:hypothetical protein
MLEPAFGEVRVVKRAERGEGGLSDSDVHPGWCVSVGCFKGEAKAPTGIRPKELRQTIVHRDAELDVTEFEVLRRLDGFADLCADVVLACREHGCG